ncbi:hypothetical protein Tco_0884197, partial [Tanacetum coccineum]
FDKLDLEAKVKRLEEQLEKSIELDRKELEAQVKSLQETIVRVTVEKEKSCHKLKANDVGVVHQH